MWIEEAGRWERPYPVRYLIVAEGDGDDAPVLLGRCAAVEGLFTDPAPPPREVLVLRGCPPGATAGPLGADAWVRGRSADGREYGWELVDAAVLAVAPNATAPTLVDVLVGAGVGTVDDFRIAQDPPVRYELGVGQDDPLAVSGAVEGLRAHRPGPPRQQVRLIGCEPAEPLRPVLAGGGSGGWPTYTELWALDEGGRVMDRIGTGLAVDLSGPSVLGGGLLDVLLSVAPEGLRGTAARAAWQLWLPGRPRRPGSWRGLSEAGKAAWQTLALYAGPTGPGRSGGEYHLAGAGVEDLTGLHCALGEAVNGPGGYYGREWNGLRDCLGGGFGVVPPFTLVWHDFAATERELAGYPGSFTGSATA